MLDSLKRVMLTRVSEVKHGVRSQSFLNASAGRKDPISVNWSPVARDLQLEAKTYNTSLARKSQYIITTTGQTSG